MLTYSNDMKSRYSAKMAQGELKDSVEIPSDAQEYMRKMEYVYGLYATNSLYIHFGGVLPGRSISDLRAYARGLQDNRIYRRLIDHEIKDGSDPNRPKKGLTNISWENAKLMPKYLGMALAKTLGDYAPVVEAIDTRSNWERQAAINRDRVRASPQMQQTFKAAGMTPAYESAIPPIAGQLDVDFAVKMNGYRLAIEAEMEEWINTSLNLSAYDLIEEMGSRDTLETSWRLASIEFNKNSNAVLVKYVDPAGAILPMSTYPDFRDVPFAGFIENVTINSIKEQVMKWGYDEKDIQGAASQYGGYRPNAQMAAAIGSYRGSRKEFSAGVYDPYTVDVMTLAWKCYDKDLGCQKIYKAKWIVGTKIIFAYGQESCVGYGPSSDGGVEAILPIIAYRCDGPSIVERCVSHIDDLQEAILRLRVFRSNLPPGLAMAIDLRLMSNAIDLGNGVSYNQLELMQIFISTGKLFYESVGAYESGDHGSSAKPITPIPLATNEAFNTYVTQINAALDMIRQTTGINEVADGTANPNDMLNRVMDGMQESSNNVLAEYSRAHARFNARLHAAIGKMYQQAIAIGELSPSKIPRTARSVMFAASMDDVPWRSLTITSKRLPGAEDIEFMRQYMISKNQTGELTTADVFICMDFLNKKDLKAMYLYMAKAVEHNKAQAAAEQQQVMAAQSQAQTEQAMAVEQAKQQTIAIEFEGKMRQDKAKHEYTMDEIRLEKGMELQNQAQLQENNFVNQN